MSDGLGGEIQRWPPQLRPTGESYGLSVAALVTEFLVNREGLHKNRPYHCSPDYARGDRPTLTGRTRTLVSRTL